ncbi:CHAT domain-containing protein [Chitinophaga sp. Mgbs1]|uniref:CHAT domain-containing protein n=1 Tax=Chitinophaga solisilvae TaxID=1233460 RepID=A0A3S1AVS5_9BACT|nr:CHAT domain-containing protein [Chitinophaga solisilvae]
MYTCTQASHIKNILRRQLLIISCLLSAFCAHAQCPPPSWFMEKITAIEQSGLPDNIRLQQLDSLRLLQLRCFPQKDSIYARILHRMGDLYHYAQKWPDALAFTKEAVAVNRSSKGRQESFLVNSYFNLGVFYNKLFLYPESQHYFDSCILTGLHYPEKRRIVMMALEARAFSLYGTGDYQRAAEAADLGILVAQRMQDTLWEVAMLAQKAQSLLAMEDSTAGSLIRKALRLLPPDAPPAHQVACYTIYASVLGKEKQYRPAIAAYRQALRVNRQQQSWDQCARNMLDLGNLYMDDMKDAGHAFSSYKEGIPFARQSGDPYILAGVYNNIGTACWKQHKYREALSWYQRGLNTLPVHFRDSSLQANPDYHMLREATNDYFVSTLLSNKGESLLALFKSTGDSLWLQYALKAYLAADMSVDLMRWKQYGEPSRLFWRIRTRAMYEKAIETCYLLQDAPAAFRFFEKSRAVLLNDKLNELGARKYLSAADISREQQLRIRVVSLQQELDATPPDSSVHQTVYQQLLYARDALERFIRGLEKAHPAYYQYKYDTAVHTVTDIRRRLLSQGETLVSYFVADSSAYILGISAGSCKLLKTTFRHTEVQELMQLCTSPTLLEVQYRQYCRLAWHLYHRLFAPLQLTAGRVIISPDEYLIPFEVLQSDSTDHSSYLLKKFAFSYTYAAGSLMKTMPVRTAAAHSLLGIAPVNYAASLRLQPLNGADQSLRLIGSNYRGALNITGERATRQRFLEQLPRSSIVQLYTHASAGDQDKDPVLYLADSALYLPEIQLLRDTVTSLLILSTCESGAGRHARGEGVLSLARGFTLTGIPAVVTSLWQMNNEATYELTENFHQLLLQGLRKDEALQQARLQYLRNHDSGHQLPYFWAAAILIGDTSAIPAPAAGNSRLYWWLAIAVVGILTLIYLFRKKRS